MVVLFCAGAWVVVAQQASDSDVYRVGSGVTSPKLLYKQEPTYPPDASRAGIQGNVLLQIVIDEQGVPQNIEVLSPLGYGLDESAIQAVSTWRFKPGEKDGRPVKVMATVETSFRVGGINIDEGAERRRGKFNAIVSRTSKVPGEKPSEKDVAAMEDLAKHKMPAALYALGLWQNDGNGVPKDMAAGLINIEKAAEAHYGPALYFVGKKMISENDERGLSRIREAAGLGSTGAQFTMGALYEEGTKVDVDLAKAKRYFRLCASAAVPDCELRLGKILIKEPQRKESDWMQGIAWLELAAGHGLAPAKELAEAEEAKLTPEQSPWVQGLSRQLERKQ